MKYESELINEILEQRGHEVPNLHYQSECIETWIKEYRGAYPKLCDYESEWLNYIVENPIGEFPYETVTTNNTATINNVVPFEYKSAILKGQTLVNITSLTGEITLIPAYSQFIETPLVKQNTTYTFMFNCTSAPSTGTIEFRQMLDNATLKEENISIVQGYNKFKVTTVNKELNRFRFKNTSTSETDFVFNNLLILEGDYTNIDISYFEGMQSVKMPVLTTTGKNLFDGNLIGGYFNNNISSIAGDDGKYKSIKIKLNKGTYTLSFERPVYVIREIIDGVYNQNVKTVTTYTFTLNTDGYYGISFRDAVSGTIWSQTQVMIEQGTVATSYEPYKSNILSTSEDVTLRKIGDVQDTLDCLTGEVTQRVGEVVLDGSEDEEWNYWDSGTTLVTGFYSNVPLNNAAPSSHLVICDKIPSIDTFISGIDKENIFSSNTGRINLNILNSKATTVDELKTYLSSNPITVQYRLATESIKTVDLSVVNQDGESLSKIKPIEGTMRIEVSGTPLNPTAILEVPVEAITQNLASFIETEE